MITSQFDFSVATYPNLKSVISSEVKEADIVEINEYLPQGIYHSTKLNWKGDLTFFDSPESFIRSESERKSLDASRTFFLNEGYELKCVAADNTILKEFSELYLQTTLKKNRAIDYKAELVVRRNIQSGTPVYIFGLFKENKLESGLIATQNKEELQIMFGAKKRFNEVRGGIGGVLEMEMLRFCFEKKMYHISHGISVNPCGIYDKSGIFEFKTRYGFTAFPYGEWKTTFILNKEVAMSDIVFLTIHQNQLSHHILTLDTSVSETRFYSGQVDRVIQQSLESHILTSKEFFE